MGGSKVNIMKTTTTAAWTDKGCGWWCSNENLCTCMSGENVCVICHTVGSLLLVMPRRIATRLFDKFKTAWKWDGHKLMIMITRVYCCCFFFSHHYLYTVRFCSFQQKFIILVHIVLTTFFLDTLIYLKESF